MTKDNSYLNNTMPFLPYKKCWMLHSFRSNGAAMSSVRKPVKHHKEVKSLNQNLTIQ